MPWSYDGSRKHENLSDAEMALLLALEKDLYGLIWPNLMRRPKYLYHYTGDVGFRGIVSSRGFRATYFRDLADKREIDHGLLVIDAGFQAMRQRLMDESYEKLLGFCYYAFAQQEFPREYYIVCFTEAADSPMHWREYGCACEGYCLELDSFKVSQSCEGAVADLQPVLYAVEEQCARVQRIIHLCWKTTLELAEMSNRAVSLNWLPHVTSLLSAHLHFHVRLMKAPEYSWEREWRIVITGPTPEPIEAGKKKRFTHLRLGRAGSMTPFAGTIVGPGQHSRVIEEVNRFWADNGFESMKARLSTVDSMS